MTTSFPRLDVTEQWGRLNDGLVDLVDSIPEDWMNWSPKPELWNFRGTLIHVCIARHGWMEDAKDGEAPPDILAAGQTRDGLKEQLRLSWERVQRFLADPARLDAAYRVEDDGEERDFTGHWIAFHLLEHDIHHRADLFHYLALLGIQHPEVETP